MRPKKVGQSSMVAGAGHARHLLRQSVTFLIKANKSIACHMTAKYCGA